MFISRKKKKNPKHSFIYVLSMATFFATTAELSSYKTVWPAKP